MARQALLRHFVLVLLMIKSNIKYSDAKQCDNTNIINILIANITANMDKAVLFDPERADLNSIASLKSSKPFCLIPKKEFYVQVDFDKPVTITGLKLKGHAIGGSDRSYHRFTLQFSFDEKTWLEYNANEQKDKNQKYFLMSNHETGTIFDCPLEKHAYARYMRIILTPPLDKIEKLCLRFDVRGCHVVPLPRIETPPIVEGIIGQEEKLKCVGEGMVGMTIGWKNYTTTTKTSSDQSSQYLMVTNESTLPVTIVLEDLASLYCQRFPTYLVCLQNYTCTGSYSFNGNATVEVSTVLKVKLYFPSQPNKFIVKEKRRGEVSLTWDSPALNNLTEDMLEFVLSCNTTGNFTTEILPMSVQSKLLTGLEVYHPYQCSLKVQMNTDSRNRVPFEFVQNPVVLNFKSLSVAPKVKPVLTAEVLSPTKIGTNFQVQFNRPEYGVISGFYLVATMFSYSSVKELSRSNIPMSEQVIKNWINDSSVRSYTITGVKPWSNYSVSIQAFNEDNLFTDITSLTVLTPEGVPSRGPKVEDQFLGTDSFIFQVNLDESFKNGEIIQYNVKIEPGNLTRTYPVSTPKPVVDTIRKLKPFQRYSFSCKAKTRLGFGPYGEVHVIITPEGIPSMPQNVHVVHVLDTNDLILRWSKPKYPNGNISKYEVRIMLNNGTEFSSYATPDAIELFTVNVSKHDVAQVKVRAQTGLGWGRMSISIYLGAKAEEKTDNESLNEVVLIVAFIAAVFFLLVLVVLCFLHHRRRRRRMNQYDNVSHSTIASFLTKKQRKSAQKKDTTVIMKTLPPSILAVDSKYPPLKLEKLPEYSPEKMEDNWRTLKEEYNNLNFGQLYEWTDATAPENKSKNRYLNVVPYNHSRVKLQRSTSIGSDYVNASYIDGYSCDNMYIAAQGPNPECVGNFWQMIWEQNVSVIVMVTKLAEQKKKNCEKYWPEENDTKRCGSIEITLKREDTFSEYVVRSFSVKKVRIDKEIRIIQQYHYLNWSVHGMPETSDLLKFHQKLRNDHPVDLLHSPLLVHCSSGGGRTGTFICVDNMLNLASEKGVVDVFNYVNFMLTRRIHMVQTQAQYILIYRALLKELSCGNTAIEMEKFTQENRKLMVCSMERNNKMNGHELQFERLNMFTKPLTGKETVAGSHEENVPKNRTKVLPRDDSRVILSESLYDNGSNEDYINAVYVDAYKKKNAFIATQHPLDFTVYDFWKMILEKNVEMIVMLNSLAENEQVFKRFCPSLKESCNFGNITVECQKEDVVALSDSANSIKTTSLIVTNTDWRTKDITQTIIISGDQWSMNGLPQNIDTLIYLLEIVDNKHFGQPVVVMCRDGAGCTGTFIATSILIQQLKMEKSVDVFETIKKIRSIRPEFVASIEQYQLCYQTIQRFVDRFCTYEVLSDSLKSW